MSVSACGGGGDGGNSADTTPPDTTIAAGPASIITTSRTATFTFTASESGVTFEASVDSGAYAVATSPLQLTNLVDGQHTISVRARDAIGNVDASPASASWRVDTTQPTASIVFPTQVSYTDATSLHVRGTAQDASPISAVLVNGIAATSSDGFATWTAVVPLAMGNNALSVTIRDVVNNVNATADFVNVANRGQSLVSPRAMDFDTAGNRILVSDQSLEAVLAVDAVTGTVSILSDELHGTGVEIWGAEGIVIDAARNRALLVDWLQDAVIAINLTSGNRTFVSPPSASTATTQLSSRVSGIAVDSVGNRAFVVSDSSNSIIGIDLATGERTVVSSAARGNGADFFFPKYVVYDAITSPSAPRLLVTDQSAVLTVEIGSGNRAILSGASPNGSGASLLFPGQIQIDVASNRLLVVDQHSQRNSLVAIDLVSGNRTTLADVTTGSGDLLVRPIVLALNGATQRAYTTDGYGSALMQVDLGTLTRALVNNSRVGTGIELESAQGVAIEQLGAMPTSLLMVLTSQRAIVRVDLATGNRTLVSDSTSGGLPNFSFPTDLVMDTRVGGGNQAFVLDAGNNSIIGVNLQSGARTLVSNLDASGALTGDLLWSLTLDAASNRIFVTDSGNDAVYAVDLASGNRTTVTGSRGSGSALSGPRDLVIDAVSNPANPRLIAVDYTLRSLIGVNIASGDRTAFSSIAPTGEGLHFLAPTCAALDFAGQRVLVSDTFHQNLMYVSLATGDRARVSGGNLSDTTAVGAGPSLMTPYGLDADMTNQVAYVSSLNRRAILAVDLISGDRVLVSH